MDSLSQWVLGSAVAYVLIGKQYPRKSILIGGLAATFPDLDIILIKPLEYDDLSMLLHHRGVTHSIIFSIFAPFLAIKLSKKWLTKLTFKTAYWLYFWIFTTHTLLDCFTSWGTQVFWPHPYKVAFNTIFIIDPLYTLPLLIGLIFYKKPGWVKKGLMVSTCYLLLCLCMKGYMHTVLKKTIKEYQIFATRFTIRPTPFNILGWTSTIDSPEYYYFSTHSVFDREISPIYAVKKNHDMYPKESLPDRIQLLLYITKDYYLFERNEDILTVRDLRFGIFSNPFKYEPLYIFSYSIHQPFSTLPKITMNREHIPNMGMHFNELFNRIIFRTNTIKTRI